MIDSARKLVRTPFSADEVKRIADQFLGHDSVRHYLTTPVLRDRAQRMVERSYAWIEDAVDFHMVGADIHVLTAEDSSLTSTVKSRAAGCSRAGRPGQR